ncbi:hypothetical protein [Cellulomonas persica]|uniref:Uncharacterized protein n=1 Tax=Cellulomonas persica TaxID=76861 RepID=A0A510UT47_9CELL|nr:hypothetical protein [Cellulomonas persica]GEK17833.1 hypothetical protein CPE01_15660 [Cellulomonas persica]
MSGSQPSGEQLTAGQRMAAAFARVEQASAALAQVVRAADERAARDEPSRREEAARRGQLGPHWQRAQVRIDAGQTTLEAVLGGDDTSPEAVAIREAARAELRRGATQPGEDGALLREGIAEIQDLLRTRGTAPGGSA